jgi:hypothetical protein
MDAQHVVGLQPNPRTADEPLLGLAVACRPGALTVANTFTSRQCRDQGIELLIVPVSVDRADAVVVDWRMAMVAHLSALKRFPQRPAGRVVRRAADIKVPYSFGSLRVLSREAPLRILVHGRCTHLLETLIPAARWK